MQTAIKELQDEIAAWINVFETKEKTTTTNPFAGEFTFDEWIHLLHKHAMHHARQFGLVE